MAVTICYSFLAFLYVSSQFSVEAKITNSVLRKNCCFHQLRHRLNKGEYREAGACSEISGNDRHFVDNQLGLLLEFRQGAGCGDKFICKESNVRAERTIRIFN